MLLEAENYCLMERKKSSLPGSIQPDGPQLFTAEDLKTQNEINKINAASGTLPHREAFSNQLPSHSSAFPGTATSCLCPHTGYKGSKFKIFSPFINLKTDLFASPGNKKFDQFVSRWPHWQATAVDALQCPLENLGDLYANPPWSVIQKFLARLRLFPQVKVLMVVPFWVSATWWPQLIKMKAPKTPCLRISPYQGMFTNCWGEKMPPPPLVGTSFA